MSLLQDIRYGARMLASKPGVTAAAVLSLALGVGANSAVFSVIDAAMLRDLPVHEPEALVLVGPNSGRGISISDEPYVDFFSYPRYQALRDGNRTLQSLAAVSSVDPRAYVRLRDDAGPIGARARLVSGDYFSTFGVQPAAGRLLGEADDRTNGGHPVVVLDYGWWQERFGGDLSAVGRSITIDDRSYQVVGVAPASFYGERLGSRPDLYVPLRMQAEIMRDDLYLERSDVSFLELVGRLAPGVEIGAAEADLARVWRAALLAEVGDAPSEEWSATFDRAPLTLHPGSAGLTALQGMRDPLKLLFAVTAFVLLIACANVANLLLARSAERKREMGLRLALGADRKRLFAQLLTESLMLAVLAGAASLLFTVWSRDVLFAMAQVDPADLAAGTGLDWRILAFTGAAALATGVLFGVAPAWEGSRSNLSAQVRGGGRGGLGARFRSGLVVAQAALSLVLLFGAGLFVQSLQQLAHADVGLASESLLTLSIDPRGAGFTKDEQPRIAQRLIGAVEATPGVQSAALAHMPVLYSSIYSETIGVPGYEPAPGEDRDARMFFATPGFLETVGAPILSGRSLGPQDSTAAQGAAVVDEVFARRFFPDQDPLGLSFILEGKDARVSIVGLVRTAKMNGAREDPTPTVYLSAYAFPEILSGLVVRTSGDPATVAADVRAAVAKAEPTLPINSVRTAEARLADQASADRMLMRLVSGFAVLALLLSAVGLYGVMSRRVAGRTSEIGLRMAVGAERGDVLRLFIKEGLALVAAGVVLGLLAAPFAGRAAASLLYQTKPWSLAPVALAAAALMAAALAAALVPSLRASRLNPVAALREE